MAYGLWCCACVVCGRFLTFFPPHSYLKACPKVDRLRCRHLRISTTLIFPRPFALFRPMNRTLGPGILAFPFLLLALPPFLPSMYPSMYCTPAGARVPLPQSPLRHSPHPKHAIVVITRQTQAAVTGLQLGRGVDVARMVADLLGRRLRMHLPG